ncbi:MAG: type II secretion system protein [Phycisphaerae bacterium]|nr:type II secretion system protein [Phycisphaerae bacterium]
MVFMKKQKGFTLIELLVVISIIALLVSILMPALSKAREKAKLVVCSSNQHQLVLGVIAYHSDNDGNFPPHSTKVARPNLLARNKNTGDDYQYRYIGKYLPEVNVFNCPMSNFDAQSRWDFGGQEYTYQQLYENKDDWFASVQTDLSCSYVLLWSYEKYAAFPANNSDNNPDTRIPPKPFMGPGKRTKNKLLVCDSFYFSNALTPQNRWTCNHKFKGASKSSSKTNPYYVAGSPGLETELDTNTDLQNIPLNAGYSDGSVRRYQSGESVRQQAVSGWAATYLPPIQMWK